MAIDTLFLIGRQKVQIATNGKIFIFDVPITAVRDLEIVDRNVLINEINNLAKKSSIIFGQVLILLSEEICFISTENEQGFLSSLPFENPVSITLNNRLIATNKDLYEGYSSAISKTSGEVKGVAPIFIAKELTGKNELNGQTIKFISSNEPLFLKNSFSFEKPSLIRQTAQKNKKENKQTLILIGIFAILLVILVAMLLLRKTGA